MKNLVAAGRSGPETHSAVKFGEVQFSDSRTFVNLRAERTMASYGVRWSAMASDRPLRPPNPECARHVQKFKIGALPRFTNRPLRPPIHELFVKLHFTEFY